MSRVIVKNIGKNTTEKQLKELFSAKGEVTDVRVIKTQGGKSRQFAFVGFRNESQAKEAQSYFNNTFLQTSKIAVDIAKSVGDKSLEKEVKSRYSKNKIEKAKKKSEKDTKKELEERRSDAVDARNRIKKASKKDDKSTMQKNEFLEVMKSRHQADIWGNDERALNVPTQSDNSSSDADSNFEDEEYVSANKLSGKSDAKKSRGTHYPLDDEDSYNSDSDEPTAVPTAKGDISDMDYLRSKMVKKSNISLSDSDSDTDDGKSLKIDNKNNNFESSNAQHQENAVHIEEYPADDAKIDEDDDEDGRLFIRNIPFSCVEDEILDLFNVYGTISQVHLPLDAEKKGKGFGFVQFLLPEDSMRAMNALDGTSFQGRLLHVMPAKQAKKKDERDSSKNSRLSAFQQKREAERKKMAHKREGWNASFVRSDAVVDALSDKYGMSQGDILDAERVGGGEMAVRLAIGETHVIQENQEYFSSHGVNIHVLESALSRAKSGKEGTAGYAERSKTTILVKNLPHDLIEDELEDMFTKYGSISSFLVPKSKTVALVDFIEPSEARNAFNGLAYRRYHHTPLYLEWAPLDTIKRSDGLHIHKKRKLSSEDMEGNSASLRENVDDANDCRDFSTLFVKNLNFLSDEDSLRNHLTKMLGISTSEIRAVSQPRKKKGDQMLSMGFAFIEFTSEVGARRHLKKINGSILDGHQLEVKPSNKRLSAPTLTHQQDHKITIERDTNATSKLLVRNIAFQATKEDLRGLFATFGSVKRIRIPRKMGGVHRGFAFIEFSSKKEAAMAKEALSSSHLYGRHLVIEYSKEGDSNDIDKLREKASNDKQAAIRIASSRSRKRLASESLQNQEDEGISEVMA